LASKAIEFSGKKLLRRSRSISVNQGIQSHRERCQSRARMQLPISD